MSYYVFIENEKINGCGECKCLNEDILNIEVSQDIYNNLEKYIYQDGEVVINPNYEQEQEAKEKKRVAMLSLTRGDVFRGLLMAKQVTRQQIRAMIENNETLTILEREMALIDFDEALNFYRGNALIDTLGATLGITSEQLDKFFETYDYTVLLDDPRRSEATSEVFNLEE